ncbi:MAG TPA: phosphotransferase family protein [Hyphomicrobiaceae bacterium]|nr:phosphotransferase family protein [Hyphomicrobiaceae bacterium]
MSDAVKGRARTLDQAKLPALAAWLCPTIAAEHVAITDASLLGGGAVQENWRLDVEVTGGPRAGRHHWVLRTDAAARLSMSLGRPEEFRCIAAAFRAGVKVAEPVALGEDAGIIGRPFMIQTLATGSAQGRRIVRDPQIGEMGPRLARELGAELARLHKIRPPVTDLGFLDEPRRSASHVAVMALREAMDAGSGLRPALEFIFQWLIDEAPEPRPTALVHGDFRTGNYMVDGGRLTAILDWEFCHWGDPREDLGWFSARCWRFGVDDKTAGGIASKADLLAGYNSVAAEPIAEAEIAYWEVLALARWGAIAALQGDRFLKDGERSLELALTGLMPAEMELDALLAIEVIAKGRKT